VEEGNIAIFSDSGSLNIQAFSTIQTTEGSIDLHTLDDSEGGASIYVNPQSSISATDQATIFL
jgi:hypothetical protein